MNNWKQEYRIRSPFTRRMIRVIGPEGLRTRDEILEALIEGRAMDWNERDCMAGAPESVPRPSLADDVVVTLCAVSGGALWPIYETTVARLREDGYSGQVVVRYGRPPEDEPAPAPSDKPTPSRGMNPEDDAADGSWPPMGRAWVERMDRLFRGPAAATESTTRGVDSATGAPDEKARVRGVDAKLAIAEAISAKRTAKPSPNAAESLKRVVGFNWGLDIQADGVQFGRFNPDGTVSELYPLVGLEQAMVWITAISYGFQPPRDLRPLNGEEARFDATR